jgi:hypothetical protein
MWLTGVSRFGSLLADVRLAARSGAELGYYEHVISRRRRAAMLQRGLDATGVPDRPSRRAEALGRTPRSNWRPAASRQVPGKSR